MSYGREYMEDNIASYLEFEMSKFYGTCEAAESALLDDLLTLIEQESCEHPE
ncbi:MAG: hypothetical protein LBE56_12305 [Tannerella sp.]|jgi:hypothetical protein|nr:hypothetical protein [Tannerella sp.]